MRYYNADGGEVEMCGNGARCFARFVNRLMGGSLKDVAPGVLGASVARAAVVLPAAATGGAAARVTHRQVSLDWRFYRNWSLRGYLDNGSLWTTGVDILWQYRY